MSAHYLDRPGARGRIVVGLLVLVAALMCGIAVAQASSTQLAPPVQAPRLARVAAATPVDPPARRAPAGATGAMLPASVRQRLLGLAQRLSGQIAVVVMTRAGDVEWTYHPDVALALASNAKLFVTGLAAHRDASIADELRRILLPSDNYLAQRLYDDESGPGSIERFAASLRSTVRLDDGSGLSRGDVASALAVGRFLAGMSADPNFAEWFNALPVAGSSGTLAGRMYGTAAQDRCQAKTGTLPGVSALSGYCTTASGHHIVFSILMNGIGSESSAREVQDGIVELLASRA